MTYLYKSLSTSTTLQYVLYYCITIDIWKSDNISQICLMQIPVRTTCRAVPNAFRNSRSDQVKVTDSRAYYSSRCPYQLLGSFYHLNSRDFYFYYLFSISYVSLFHNALKLPNMLSHHITTIGL